MILDEYRPFVAREHEVRAILEGRQTQLRRMIKPQPPSDAEYWGCNGYRGEGGPSWWWSKENGTKIFPTPGKEFIQCPYGKPGDRLYVKETWCSLYDSVKDSTVYLYKADDDNVIKQKCGLGKDFLDWHPAVTMPRKASRITLEVKRVWVERVQDISEQDAIACGVPPFDWNNGGSDRPIPEFKKLWDSMNKSPWQWDDNPWVWCVEFGMIQEP